MWPDSWNRITSLIGAIVQRGSSHFPIRKIQPSLSSSRLIPSHLRLNNLPPARGFYYVPSQEMSGKFLSKTTRKQGWAVEGALKNPQVHAWQAFFSTGKELWPQNSQQPPPTPTGFSPLLPRPPAALARLHALSSSPRVSAPGAHTGERARLSLLILPARVAPLAPLSLARGGHPRVG